MKPAKKAQLEDLNRQMFSTYNDILPASSTTQLINNKLKHTSLVFPTEAMKMDNKHKEQQQQRTRGRPFRIPLEPLKEGHLMDPMERMFLEAVERGDKQTVLRCLRGARAVNVNCTNMLGRSAIQIAVDNENVELVELLLRQEGVKIGDALLYAVCEGVYRIVEMLIDHPSITSAMLGCDWWLHKSAEGEETSDEFSPDISPVILAAHCNQFEILQLLLSRGARIVKPHPLSCSCQKCRKENMEDSLRHSLLRIQTYRALSSPAWISLTSPDPVLTAFRLSWELDHLAMRENEFKDLYANLSEQCKKYACNLLDQCRSSEEVVAILNKPVDPATDYWDTEWSDVEECNEEDDDEDVDVDNDDHNKTSVCGHTRLTLDRFKLALKYRQKQFVAHPHCQQLLASIWYEGIPGWRRHNFMTKVVIIVSLICLLPVMALIYLVFPRSKIGRLVRTPFMKFMYHSVSFGVFLFFLILASTNVGSGGADQTQRQNQRGPPPTNLEWMIVVYVMGFVWAECKQLWEEGLKAYIRQWWNWLDFIMLSLYLCTLSLRLIAFFHSQHPEIYGPNISSRSEWPDADPTLVSEGVFAIANVFSFARIIYLFQANPQLGPLQISLGCMLIDIGKFFFIFFLVITSFACGLNQLYYFYSATSSYASNNSSFSGITSYLIPPTPSTTSLPIHKLLSIQTPTNAPTSSDYENAFDPIYRSYVTLFWSLFGLTQLKTVREGQLKSFTKAVGECLLMFYHTMAVIVLINMLIAMMSNSFQEIEDLDLWTMSMLFSSFDRSIHGFDISRLNTSFVTLFWTLFGIVNLDVLELEVRSVEGFGKVLFGLYNVAARILFLNMLIAMMSKSFNVTVDHADREWKFARSKLWMGYFDDGSTLPPPFNLIISPKSVLYVLRRIKCIIVSSCFCHQKPSDQSTYCQPKRTGHVTNLMIGRKKYDDVMRRLVSRFIHQWKKQLRQGGVNEDDLLEIKQDISSLRFELREDRKKGEFQLSFMMEGLKKDIARLVTSSIESRDRLNASNCTPSITRRKDLHGSAHVTSRNSSMEREEMSPGDFLHHHHHHHHKSSVSLCEDMQLLKKEVLGSLRLELKDLMKEAMDGDKPFQQHHDHHQQHHDHHHHQQHSNRTSSPELYHSHMYTQL